VSNEHFQYLYTALAKQTYHLIHWQLVTVARSFPNDYYLKTIFEDIGIPILEYMLLKTVFVLSLKEKNHNTTLVFQLSKCRQVLTPV